MHPCHVFCCHVWVLQHVHSIAFRWLLAVNRRPVSFLNRLPFPNRNSDSGVLYIVFKRFHLIFPMAPLEFQVEARFMHFLSYLAFCIPHRIPHSISSFHHIAWSCTWLTVSLLLVCLVWVEPGDEFANEEPVEFAFEDPVNSDNCAGKMIIPSKSLLSLLCQMLALLLCLCYDAYHLLIMPPKLPCQTSNPPCPSKPLIGYVTALLSPSYSVASCR